MESDLGRRQVLRGAVMAAAGAAVAGAFPAGTAEARSGPADLIVHNGRVLTLDQHFRSAEAIAVRGGRVLAVGGAREVKRLAGPRTQLLDAAGGTVLPGINDSHLHLSSFGLNRPPWTYDVDKATIDEVVEAVRAAVAQAPSPDSWIRGGGWQELKLPRAPRAADIDPVSGNHPVVLKDFSGHAISVNSAVLRLAGITRDTVPPVGGVIDKDADGEPTGVLRETARNLVQSVIPAFSAAEVSQAIDIGVGLLHAVGITSLTEPGIGLDTLEIYRDKARARRLPMRITALLSGGMAPATVRRILGGYRPAKDVDPRFVRVAGIKVYADGIPRFHTSWMNQPYLDGTNGTMVIDGANPAEQIANLHEMIRLATDAGMQVGTHATGDATTDAVVAGYVKAGGPDLRHYVIHCNFPSAATLRTMARHDIGANLNAEILYLQGRVLESIIGPELTEYQWPYRSALNAGVRVASGSDAPVVAPAWLRGVLAATLREGAAGQVAGEAERITVREALATYTSTSAWQDHAERWKGTLEPGKAADICVVGGDVLEVDPHDLGTLPITATVVDGRVVYERSSGAQGTLADAAALTTSGCSHNGRCCCEVAEEIRG